MINQNNNILKSRQITNLYSTLSDWDKKLWHVCHIHINDLISNGNPANYRTSYMMNGSSQIIIYKNLYHLLSINYLMNKGLCNYYSSISNNYHLSHKQIHIGYQSYQNILFNLFSSKEALNNCTKFSHINVINNNTDKILDYINHLLFLYQGNYQFRLLTDKDKSLILNLLIITLMHNNYNNLQLCILPLFMNISSKKLANLSNISYITIKKLRKPYSMKWLYVYNSLTYQDAKHLSQILISYLKNPHTSIIMMSNNSLNVNMFFQDYYVKPVVNYGLILKKVHKLLPQSKKMFQKNRMNDKKADEING